MESVPDPNNNYIQIHQRGLNFTQHRALLTVLIILFFTDRSWNSQSRVSCLVLVSCIMFLVWLRISDSDIVHITSQQSWQPGEGTKLIWSHDMEVPA